MQKIFTVPQLADMLHKTPQRIYAWISRGFLRVMPRTDNHKLVTVAELMELADRNANYEELLLRGGAFSLAELAEYRKNKHEEREDIADDYD